MQENDSHYFNEEVLDSLEAEVMTYLRANLNSEQIKTRDVSQWSFKSYLAFRTPAYFLVLSRYEYQYNYTILAALFPC
jgi:hypothetical protein